MLKLKGVELFAQVALPTQSKLARAYIPLAAQIEAALLKVKLMGCKHMHASNGSHQLLADGLSQQSTQETTNLNQAPSWPSNLLIYLYFYCSMFTFEHPNNSIQSGNISSIRFFYSQAFYVFVHTCNYNYMI